MVLLKKKKKVFGQTIIQYKLVFLPRQFVYLHIYIHLVHVFVFQRHEFLQRVRIHVSRGSSCLMMSEPDRLCVFSGVGGELGKGGAL